VEAIVHDFNFQSLDHSLVVFSTKQKGVYAKSTKPLGRLGVTLKSVGRFKLCNMYGMFHQAFRKDYLTLLE